eukprot:2595760-Rhodomonas_salina.1
MLASWGAKSAGPGVDEGERLASWGQLKASIDPQSSVDGRLFEDLESRRPSTDTQGRRSVRSAASGSVDFGRSSLEFYRRELAEKSGVDFASDGARGQQDGAAYKELVRQLHAFCVETGGGAGLWIDHGRCFGCLLYTSPSPRDRG